MKSRSHGFTLIEMLVALVIFSALVSVLFFGFKQTIFMWEKGKSESDLWQHYLLHYNALEQMFIQSVAANYQHNKLYYDPYFKGSADDLQMISSFAMLSPVGVVLPIELRWQSVQGGVSLEYRQGERGEDPERGIRMTASWEVLMGGLKEGSFKYEAPAYDPFGLINSDAALSIYQWYRKKPKWLFKYDAYKLKVMPRRVALNFTDSKGIKHKWRFLLRENSAAQPESVYSGE